MESAVVGIARREVSWLAKGAAGLLHALPALVGAVVGPDLDDLTIPGLEFDHDDLWDQWR